MRISMVIGIAGAAAAFTAAGVASAGISAPALHIQFAAGSNMFEWTPAGSSTKTENMYHYAGQYSGEGWLFEFDINADPDPAVFSTVNVTNVSGVTQVFSVMTLLPIAPAITPTSVMGGSSQGGLTADDTAGVLAALPGGAMYRAMIDGATVASLFAAPSSVAAGAFGSNSTGGASFGNPIPSAPGPQALASIAILHEFTLTPGDRATFTSSFVVQVPGPGGMALMGIAGLIGARRRRA